MYRILVVDNEQNSHNEYRRIAARITADSILLEETWSAEEAEERLQGSLPHLLVADAAQPGMTDFLNRWAAQATSGSELVIVSSVSDTELLRRALQWRALDYLIKSRCSDELAALITRQIEAKAVMPRPNSVGRRTNQSVTIATIHQIICDDRDVMYSVTELAERFGITPNYLSYLFKKEEGMTFSAYQCRIKMEQARRLILEQPTLKIYEVAMQLGYSDEKYFSRVFHRYHRMTPTQYRAEFAGKPEKNSE